MSRHRHDIGGFQPTNTLHSPSLHSSHHALLSSRHSSPLQTRKKRSAPEQLVSEQPRNKRRRSPQQHHDVEDEYIRFGLGQTWQAKSTADRRRSDSRERQSATSPSRPPWLKRGSENAFASPFATASERLTRGALNAVLFQNSEYHQVEERMKPSPRSSARSSRKNQSHSLVDPLVDSLLSEVTDPLAGEHVKLQRDNRGSTGAHDRQPHVPSSPPYPATTNRRANVNHSRSKHAKTPPHGSDALDDSPDELAEGHTSYRSRARGPLRSRDSATKTNEITQKPSGINRRFAEIPLKLYQTATASRGRDALLMLRVSTQDDDPRAHVICAAGASLTFHFTDFKHVVYTQENNAALLLQDENLDADQGWVYLQFGSLKLLSTLLHATTLFRLEQEELRSEKIHELLSILKRAASASTSIDEPATASPYSNRRVTSRLKPPDSFDHLSEPVQPRRETRARMAELAESKSDVEVNGISRQSSSSTKTNHIPSASQRYHHDSPTPHSSRFAEINRHRKPWKEALIYPRTGRHRATVEWADLERLDDEEFLNDNIISFCLLHLQNTGPGLLLNNQVYFFNTFFYTTLTKPVKGQRGINYQAVKSWTKKVDLFGYDYIVVPIHKDLHWYCAIICNVRQLQADGLSSESESPVRVLSSWPPLSPTTLSKSKRTSGVATSTSGSSVIDVDSTNLNERTSQLSIQDTFVAETQSKTEPETQDSFDLETPNKNKKRGRSSRPAHDVHEPLIIILDSLGNSHPEVSRHLKDYLRAEALDKRNIVIDKEPKGLNAKGQPGQHNFSDCGVFLVAYLTRFAEDPAKFVEAVVNRDSQFWTSMEADKLRKLYLDRILQTYDWTHSDSDDKKQAIDGNADERATSSGSSSAKRASDPEQQDRRDLDQLPPKPKRNSKRDKGATRMDTTRLSTEIQVPASDDANSDTEIVRVGRK